MASRGNSRGGPLVGKKPLPRGDKISAAELARRVDIVEGLLASGVPRHKIQEIAKAQFSKDAAGNAIATPSVRSVDRYISAATARVRASRDAVRASEVDLRLARLYPLATKLERKEQWAPLARIETLITDIVGARAPTKVQVSGTIAHVVVSADLKDFTDEELDAAERLNRKFLAALRARGVEAPKAIADTTATVSDEEGQDVVED